jgi:hypothetical protein
MGLHGAFRYWYWVRWLRNAKGFPPAYVAIAGGLVVWILGGQASIAPLIAAAFGVLAAGFLILKKATTVNRLIFFVAVPLVYESIVALRELPLTLQIAAHGVIAFFIFLVPIVKWFQWWFYQRKVSMAVGSVMTVGFAVAYSIYLMPTPALVD